MTPGIRKPLVKGLNLRTFNLHRTEDESGVSGTGIVTEGVEFSDGTCVMHWLTSTTSTAFYKNINELVQIHGHGGKTIAVFEDGERVTDV